MPVKAVFDLGGVLIDWDPRYLYRKLLAERPRWRSSWPLSAPRSGTPSRTVGRPFAEGVAELVERHPEHAAAIAAYHERWPRCWAATSRTRSSCWPSCCGRPMPVYALTNWSAETFVVARERFGS